MEIINETPWRLAYLPGRLGFPKHSLTMIVKGTFDLVPGGVVTLAQKQLYPTGDEPYPDDEEGTGGPRYESDFAHFKPRADLLVVGRCVPRNGGAGACDVTVKVGGHSRTLRVFGDRLRKGRQVSEPRVFASLEMRWENSLGGPEDEGYPLGKGAQRDDGRPTPMPNIVDPKQPTVPAGFAPRSRLWQERFSCLGTYGDDYLTTRWPWFARDFDPAFYNAAAPAMQMAGYLRGDEALSLQNLHADHGVYLTTLPGLRPRCFLNRASDNNGEQTRRLSEVAMHLDTLWVDMEAAQLVLVWRGVAEVPSPELTEVLHAFVISEELDKEPSPPEVFDGWFKARCAELDIPLDPTAGAKEKAPGPTTGGSDWLGLFTTTVRQVTTKLFPKAVYEMPPPTPAEKKVAKKIGVELGTEPWTREQTAAAILAGKSLAGLDLSELDLGGLDLSGVDLSGTTLTGAKLREANLREANLTGAILLDADLGRADLCGAKLARADLSDADLQAADLSGADLRAAICERANLDHAVLASVTAEAAVFGEALLTKADFSSANLDQADLSRATLVKARFANASLREARLLRANGAGLDMSNADLTELRAADANLTGATFAGARAAESIWVNARLGRCDFSRAKLMKADFEAACLDQANLFGADARGAKLPKADLRRAKLTQSNLFGADLEGADLTKADLRRANLYGAQLQDAVLGRTKVRGANLCRTRLAAQAEKARRRPWPFAR